MKISVAERRDLPRILAIQKEAYLSEAAIYNDYSLPPLLQSLDEMEFEFGAKTFFKAEVDRTLVGSIRAALVGSTCYIEKLIVDPKFQGRGIGSALLLHAESVFAAANRFEFFTGSKSIRNIKLYSRHGYVVVREESVSPHVSLVHMQKMSKVA